MRKTTLILMAGLIAAASAGATDIVDGVAAVVNDRVITYSDVKAFVQPVVQQLRRNYSGQELIEKVRAAQLDALNTLIDRALIIQEFNKKGHSVPDNFVEEQINEIIANEFGGNRAAFIKTLQAQNMTLSQYRDQVRDRIIVQAMRARKTQQEVVVSPYKIEKYYEQNIEQFKVPERIKLRMIYVRRGEPQSAPVATNSEAATVSTTNADETATDDTDSAAPAPEESQVETAGALEMEPPAPAPPQLTLIDPRRALAEEILAKLDEGESFESMARVYSEGKEAKGGGDWGWIGRDILRKELNEIAFTLKPGQHSRLIETAEGYYILQVDDVSPEHLRALPEVRDEIERALLQQQRAKMQESWIKDLRAKAYIRLF
jgi:peptidyl-prolyl cis-trans isomerase SurA